MDYLLLTGTIFKKKYMVILSLLIWSQLFFSCAIQHPEVTIKEEPPAPKITSLDKILRQIGKMTEIYGSVPVNIQSKDVGDETGKSEGTKGEIPRDISKMVESTLNSVGGKITYVPYDPVFLMNMAQTGYSNFQDKIIPDVVVTGGITEFDVGLEVRGSDTKVGVEAEFTENSSVPKWTPSNVVDLKYEAQDRESLSSITVDFNLREFRTSSGVAGMQTINTVKVYKAAAEKELGFSIFGPTFGMKGTVQKIQGRHAATRLLVQLSMIQLVGKYLGLPYWRLLPDAQPDPVVTEAIVDAFLNLSETDQIRWTQEFLILHGYDVEINGIIDEKTKAALVKFDHQTPYVSKDTFLTIYCSVPLEPIELALMRRKKIIALLSAPPKVTPQQASVSEESPKQEEVKKEKKNTKKTKQRITPTPSLEDDLLNQIERKENREKDEWK